MNKYYNQKYFEERDLLVPHIAKAIEIFAKEMNLKRILDVGCGNGRLVKYLNEKGFKAIGCDLSKIAVKKALKLNKKKIIFHGSATNLPFNKNSFDLVCAISVIEHLTKNEGEKFIKQAKDILVPNGHIFLITPNFISPLKYIQGENWCGFRDPTHLYFYTPRSLAKLLKKEGFSKIQFYFKTKFNRSFEWEFPPFFSKLPLFIKYFLIFLFFQTSLVFLRNGFWIAAQKQK